MIPRKVAFATVAALATTASFAQTVFGLTNRDQLVSWNVSAPEMLTSASFISGLASNETVVGIDYRSNGSLYALGSYGNIYTLNTVTAAATFVSSIGVQLSGTEFGVDFNPVADRLRVVSNLGQNLRINVDTGATTVDGTINPVSHLMGGSYTNTFVGSTSTTLYTLDSNTDMLHLQSPPNAGGQVPVGSLGIDFTGIGDIEILANGSGGNVAYAALQTAGTSGSSFWRVNLATGAATSLGMVGMGQSSDTLAIRDLAIAPVPEPMTMLALGSGLAALMARRRRK